MVIPLFVKDFHFLVEKENTMETLDYRDKVVHNQNKVTSREKGKMEQKKPYTRPQPYRGSESRSKKKLNL